MDLIREILLTIEAQPPGKLIRQIELPDTWTPEEVNGHLRLVDQAGLVDGNLTVRHDYVHMALHGLSNYGHDFLDSIRSETVWERTKDQLKTVGGSAAIETFKAVATAIATAIATAHLK